jgi:hypothetical protein
MTTKLEVKFSNPITLNKVVYDKTVIIIGELVSCQLQNDGNIKRLIYIENI